jgi:hypothetical protein
MRKFLKFPYFYMSWFYWLLGHISYKICDHFDNAKWNAFWYAPYNFFMIQSYREQRDVNGEGKWWPWGEAADITEDEPKSHDLDSHG